MWLLIREASVARNLQALLPLVREFGPSRMAFCTDDREPEHIAEDGHVNAIVREPVASGIKAVDALTMGSHNAALWHGLDRLGAVAPGYQADLLVLPDLERFVPELVLKRGAPVGEIPRAEVPEWVKHTVRVEPVSSNDFRVPWSGGRARVIGLVPGQIVTERLEEEPTVEDGLAIADPSRNLAKVAVIERHLGTGRMAVGFVRGFDLDRGALASTVAHDAHNIVVVGVDDGDMARAVQRLKEIGGGAVVIASRGVHAELPLPVAGLLSDAPLAEVVEASEGCVEAARELGCTAASPFQVLAFLALSVIPSLKITDRGLVDVDLFDLVPLAIDTQP
jgi:adenine deaminase